MSICPKLIHRYNRIPIKNPKALLYKLTTLKFCMSNKNLKKPRHPWNRNTKLEGLYHLNLRVTIGAKIKTTRVNANEDQDNWNFHTCWCLMLPENPLKQRWATSRGSSHPCIHSRAERRRRSFFRSGIGQWEADALFTRPTPSLVPSIKAAPSLEVQTYKWLPQMRPWIVILCWSWINPSLLEKYLAICFRSTWVSVENCVTAP